MSTHMPRPTSHTPLPSALRRNLLDIAVIGGSTCTTSDDDAMRLVGWLFAAAESVLARRLGREQAACQFYAQADRLAAPYPTGPVAGPDR